MKPAKAINPTPAAMAVNGLVKDFLIAIIPTPIAIAACPNWFAI
jgi:hypothetical protein